MFALKNRKQKKSQKAYEAKRLEAMEAQRSGNIQRFSQLDEEAEAILRQIQEVET